MYFVIYYVRTCREMRSSVTEEIYRRSIFSFFSSHWFRVIVRFSNTLTFRCVIGVNFTRSRLVHQKRFIRQRPRSLSFIRKGLPRNYKDRWHVLSVNQSRASNRVRRHPGLRKAFRAAPAAVTFWVAIVKREKESWTGKGQEGREERGERNERERDRRKESEKWERNDKDGRGTRGRRRKEGRNREGGKRNVRWPT